MTLWELLPGLERRAGRRRAARYLGSPLPDHIHDPRGGQRGWSTLPSKRHAVTTFRFDPPLDRAGLLSAWQRLGPDDTTVQPVLLALLGEHIDQVDELYHRSLDDRAETVWLLVDQGAARGVLYAI